MSRSIHSTHNEYGWERRFRYSDEQAQDERLAAIRERIEKKRRIKWRVLNERGKLPSASLPPLPPAAPEAVPINIIEQGEWIHYPASSADLQGVMKRLPVGVLTGLSGIRLCLGKDYQENNLTAEELARAERDPWVGRAGQENLPGVFGGNYLGSYWIHPARIDLYAYVYDSALPQRGMWELFLRLQMLSTFVHEVAHHEDYMRRVARGRWRADDTGKNEAFAETTASRWVQQCVVPYLEEAYPDAVRDLDAWIQHHGGTAIPLVMLANSWRWDTDGKVISVYFGSALEAFENLVHEVHQGGERTATRLEFARDLHYGENFTEALSIIGRVLEEQPANPEALTLQADIFVQKQEYQQAETLARRVVNRDENYVDAWMVLADVYEEQEDWTELLVAAGHGVAAAHNSDWERDKLLLHRARANLELQRYANLTADLETLSETPYGKRRADPLRALLLLRTGQYEEAFRLAKSHSAEWRAYDRAIFDAVRFEAAQKLGRPAEGGKLSTKVLDILRRLHYNDWVDRLVAEYNL